MAAISRPRQIYGRGNPIPVGHTNFYDNFVYRQGGPEFIPGTKVPRLRPVALGARAIGFFDDEVDAVVEGLRAERDAKSAAAAPNKKLAKAEPTAKRHAVDRKIITGESAIT